MTKNHKKKYSKKLILIKKLYTIYFIVQEQLHRYSSYEYKTHTNKKFEGMLLLMRSPLHIACNCTLYAGKNLNGSTLI